jgi:hypothetical protein
MWGKNITFAKGGGGGNIVFGQFYTPLLVPVFYITGIPLKYVKIAIFTFFRKIIFRGNFYQDLPIPDKFLFTGMLVVPVNYE